MLYGQVFPAYFGAAAHGSVASSITQGGGQWWNLYRRTDPIGAAIFDDDAAASSATEPRQVNMGDIEVDDPATRAAPEGGAPKSPAPKSAAPGRALGDPGSGSETPENGLEPAREPWGPLASHSNYEQEWAFKDAVARMSAHHRKFT